MDRVVVIGCAGSGKTYLARRLAAAIGAPVVHLDALYYDAAWRPTPPAEFAARQREVVAGPRWVVDGNHLTTMPIRLAACDTVVFADVSTAAALAGVLGRYLRHGAGQRGGGVFNRLRPTFLWYVVTYRRRMRPRVLARIAEHAAGNAADRAAVVRLTSRRRVRRWLAEVEGRRGGVLVRGVGRGDDAGRRRGDGGGAVGGDHEC